MTDLASIIRDARVCLNADGKVEVPVEAWDAVLALTYRVRKLRDLIASDQVSISYQTMEQYRMALLKAMGETSDKPERGVAASGFCQA